MSWIIGQSLLLWLNAYITLQLKSIHCFFCVLKSKRSTRLWDKVPGCNVCQRSSAGVKHVPFTLSKTFQTCLKSSRPVVRCISEWEAKAKNCKLSSMLFVRVICRPRDWLISMDNGYELLSNVHKSIGIRYSCFFRDFIPKFSLFKKKKNCLEILSNNHFQSKSRHAFIVNKINLVECFMCNLNGND